MPKTVQDRITTSIQAAKGLYYRLVLLVGLSGSGKTGMLADVAKILDTRVVNINLEVSTRLLELTQKQRSLRLPQVLDQIISEEQSVFIFDNTELVFDVSLKHDPLRLLQGISRNKTILASWNGHISKNKLIYAEPGHPEYKSYNLNDLIFVSMV